MKVEIKVLGNKQFDVCKIRVSAGVRYWQDSDIDGVSDNDCEEDGNSPIMPCVKYLWEQNYYLRANNWRWCPIINVDDGRIDNWEIGKTADIHYKVYDDFLCNVLDKYGNVVCKYYYYVPKIMCHAEKWIW